MSTDVVITVYGENAEAVRQAAEKAMAAIDLVDRLMNQFDPASELSAINNEASSRPVAMSRQLRRVLEISARMWKTTDGAFDVTVGPAMDLWKNASASGRLPTEEELKTVTERIGFQNLAFDGDTVSFRRPGVEITLGGIAKGYAVDCAVEALQASGVTRAIVDAGGDLRTLGLPPDRDAWIVGVRDPAAPDSLLTRVRIADAAIATSGDYERFFEVAGKRFSHFIDPTTAEPVERLMSATVIAGDAATADALATALCVMGPDKGLGLIESLDDAECLIISITPSGPAIIRSKGLASYESD